MSEPSARLVIDVTALRRGIVAGCVVIVPASALLALLDPDHHAGNGGWRFVVFVLILYAFATAGYGAARTRPDAPLTHGILAGLGAYAVWIVVRLCVPLALRNPVKLGVLAVVGDATFAVALGALGGVFAARRGPTALPRD